MIFQAIARDDTLMLYFDMNYVIIFDDLNYVIISIDSTFTQLFIHIFAIVKMYKNCFKDLFINAPFLMIYALAKN